MKDNLSDSVKALDGETREDVEDLFETLRENLARIREHGTRADSIVKGMLAHARQGPGTFRVTDLNGLIEESLNLSYHGARAENPAFNVALERDFDPEAGAIELIPQEISRVFLNLIGHGGTVDKVVGDAIHAIFGAPLD